MTRRFSVSGGQANKSTSLWINYKNPPEFHMVAKHFGLMNDFRVSRPLPRDDESFWARGVLPFPVRCFANRLQRDRRVYARRIPCLPRTAKTFVERI